MNENLISTHSLIPIPALFVLTIITMHHASKVAPLNPRHGSKGEWLCSVGRDIAYPAIHQEGGLGGQRPQGEVTGHVADGFGDGRPVRPSFGEDPLRRLVRDDVLMVEM